MDIASKSMIDKDVKFRYNDIRMLLFLYGPDTFRSRQQLKKMIEKFTVDRDPQGLNTVRLDCEKERPEKILQEIHASPFLAEKRMVILENLLVSKQTEVRADILQRMKDDRLPSTTVIVLWEEAEPKTKDAKALYEQLKKEKYAQSFAKLSGMKLEAWIKEEIAHKGGKMSGDAIKYLVTTAAGDTWQLNSVLEQLVAYVGNERAIERSDIQLFLEDKVDDNIFNLIDSIVGKQPKHVFAMIEEQYRQGQDASYIFAMLVRQFRILLELRDLFEREEQLSSDALAKKLGLHPFVVKKSLPLVKRYRKDELVSLYHNLLDIDIQTKTGGAPQELLLDVFVGKMSVR